MFKLISVFLILAITCFSQVLYKNLGANDNIVTNIPKTIVFDQAGATNLFTFDSKTGITNAVPTSRLSVSNTVLSFWIGYDGEYISETNSTFGAVNGRMYFILKP